MSEDFNKDLIKSDQEPTSNYVVENVDLISSQNNIQNADAFNNGNISRTAISADELENELDQNAVKRVVVARGTEDGLVLRIDGKSDWNEVISEIRDFMGERKKFFEGGQIYIEWLDRLPTLEQSDYLESYLVNEYGIKIAQRRRKPGLSRVIAKEFDNSNEQKGASVYKFDFAEGVKASSQETAERSIPYTSRLDEPLRRALDVYSKEKGLTGSSNSHKASKMSLLDSFKSEFDTSSGSYLSQVADILGEEFIAGEDANAKIVFGTLRSGQKVETPFSLIVVGDVNPGADLVAGGDIFVLGALRGTAHASAYDDSARDKIVFALKMQPMQLRIGSIISRGNKDDGTRGAELARIDDRRIVVEGFNSKSSVLRRK